MTVPFSDLSQREWSELLLRNYSVQGGGSLIGFRGVPFQRGQGFGTILKSLFRAAAPITKKIIKNVAKEGLSSAVQLGSDVLEGRNFKESAEQHLKNAGKRLVKKGLKSAKKRLQKGSGIGYKRKKPIKRKTKRQIGFGKRRKTKKGKKDIFDY